MGKRLAHGVLQKQAGAAQIFTKRSDEKPVQGGKLAATPVKPSRAGAGAMNCFPTKKNGGIIHVDSEINTSGRVEVVS